MSNLVAIVQWSAAITAAILLWAYVYAAARNAMNRWSDRQALAADTQAPQAD
ncbi:MAG: hypothetical protein KDA72_00810 [Planctomycetales bacterium]|nr:hypothetical protein [Planctomycetales bacterium]